MKDIFTDLILKRLGEATIDLKKQFFQENSLKISRYFVLDNLLPESLALEIYTNFPKPKNMPMLNGLGRLKLKYSHLKDTHQIIKDINAAIQDPRVVKAIEHITEINHLMPDVSNFAGGVSTLEKGFYLNPHIDISHNVENKNFYRAANVLYYISPDWALEKGGSYEIWDEKVEQCIIVPALFNRLLVMETNSISWHGVSEVLCDEPRCCIFNYYFSEQSPEGKHFSKTVASFKAHPKQKIYRTLQNIKEKLKKGFF